MSDDEIELEIFRAVLVKCVNDILKTIKNEARLDVLDVISFNLHYFIEDMIKDISNLEDPIERGFKLHIVKTDAPIAAE